MGCYCCGEPLTSYGFPKINGVEQNVCVTCENLKSDYVNDKKGTPCTFKVKDKVFVEWCGEWFSGVIASIEEYTTPKGSFVNYLCYWEHSDFFDDDKDLIEDSTCSWFKNIKIRTTPAGLVDNPIEQGYMNYTKKERWFGEHSIKKIPQKILDWIDSENNKQSSLFDTKVVEKVSPIDEESDDKLSDEELAEKYPVESGEVEDEPNSDEEPIEEEFVEQKNEQVSLFGSSPVKKVDKIKLLEAQKQDLWDLEWVKRTLEIVAEIDSGKVFDNNEVDGLYRDFGIGSAGYEELGIPEEDFEKLGYEQYVKKCLQHSLKFQTEELGISIEEAKELTHESIEEQINELDKQIEAEKELQRNKKAVKQKVVVENKVQQRLIL